MNGTVLIPRDSLFRPMTDPFGRTIRYLRVSVTDRCDLRCIYCMSERMRFLPRNELLTIEELDLLCAAFIKRGVRRLRFTGGEPLLRDDLHVTVPHNHPADVAAVEATEGQEG